MDRLSPAEKKLQTRFLGYSILFHLSFIGFFYLISLFQDWNILPETKILCIQLGGGVGDQEGLPFKESKTLPKTTIEEQKKASFEQPPPKEEEKIKIKPEQRSSEEEKIAMQEKIKKKKEEAKKQEDKKAKEDARIKDALAKINKDLKEKSVIPEAAQAKQGGAGDPSGSPEGVNNSECGRYSAQVKQKIVNNWIRLIGSNRPPKSPKISVMINASGEIISTPEWIEKSGDYSLDMSTLRAVQNSSPFPPPPADCQEAVREGFVVVFGK